MGWREGGQEMNCNLIHLQPEKWTKGPVMPDGRRRCYCPECKAFKGFIVPQTEPKQAKKGKAR